MSQVKLTILVLRFADLLQISTFRRTTMRRTGFLTIILVINSFALGCAGEAASLSTTKPSNAVPATQAAEVAAADRHNATSGASGIAGDSLNQAAKAIPVGMAVKQVMDNTSLSQAQTALIDTSPTDRKIIRNADLSLESQSPGEAQRRITAIAEANGGFVVESQQTSSDAQATKRDIVSITVRVPSNNFTETLDQIRATSEKVVFETIKGDDVTEEFIDIEARLKAKKGLEQQFAEIMKRAGTIQEALSVQSQLADVRSEIEKIEGRKRFLASQSSLSTIKIKLQTPEVVVLAATQNGYADRVAQAFAVGLDFAMNFVLGLMTILVAIAPFAILVGLPAVLILRYFWKKHGRARSVLELAKEELDAA